MIEIFSLVDFKLKPTMLRKFLPSLYLQEFSNISFGLLLVMEVISIKLIRLIINNPDKGPIIQIK